MDKHTIFFGGPYVSGEMFIQGHKEPQLGTRGWLLLISINLIEYILVRSNKMYKLNLLQRLPQSQQISKNVSRIQVAPSKACLSSAFT